MNIRLRAVCACVALACVVSACGSGISVSQQLQNEDKTLTVTFNRYFFPKGQSSLDQTFGPSFSNRARLLASGLDRFDRDMGRIPFPGLDIGDSHALIRAGVSLVTDLNEAAEEGAHRGPSGIPSTNPLSPFLRDPSELALWGWTINWIRDVELFNRDVSILRNELGLNA